MNAVLWVIAAMLGIGFIAAAGLLITGGGLG